MEFPDSLAADARRVIERTEELLAATAGAVGDRVDDTRAGLTRRLRRVKSELADLEYAARRHGKRAVRAVDGYARDNPWQVAGIVAVVAAAITLIVLSQRDD